MFDRAALGRTFQPAPVGQMAEGGADDMVGGARALIEQSAPGVLHHDLAMCAAYDSAVESASGIDAPTTLLLGELDRMTPPSKAQLLIDAISDGRVVMADGVGHMIQIEAPELTRTLIAKTVMAAASV